MFRRLLTGSSTAMMAVVKSNAYGHGSEEVAKMLQTDGIRWFGVASFSEARHLRDHGIRHRILVLSYIDDPDLQTVCTIAKQQNITLPIYTIEMARTLSRVAVHAGITLTVHIKVDTGTTRLGFTPQELLGVYPTLSKLRGLRIEGIFTHFADAENIATTFTDRQLSQLLRVHQQLNTDKHSIPLIHAACSAATLHNPNSRLHMVRLGIALYGLNPLESSATYRQRVPKWFSLQPVLSWKTTVLQVHSIHAGTTVGYGRTFMAKKPSRIATLPIGYADGFDRGLSNIGSVLIKGKRAPVVGRVCMNLTMVDVTHIPHVKAGDEVVLIGKQGSARITAVEMADLLNTIHYEVVTRIHPDILRTVV